MGRESNVEIVGDSEDGWSFFLMKGGENHLMKDEGECWIPVDPFLRG